MNEKKQNSASQEPLANAVPQEPSAAGVPTSPPAATKKPLPVKKPAKKRRLLIGCFAGIFAFFIFVVIALALIMGTAGTQKNPFLELFGIDVTNINAILLTLTNFVYGLLVFVAFIIAIIGIFRLSMAKKGDTLGRKKGLTFFLLGTFFFILLLFFWIGTYFYLREKVPVGPGTSIDYILTDPESTIGLTAPMEITFDASQIRMRTGEILQYSWDFGDGINGNGNPIKHTYRNKGKNDGRYKVVLTITYQPFGTRQDEKVQYSKDVVFANEKVAALFTVTSDKGPVPLKVDFDASESIDPDGEIVNYEWDFNGDGQFDDAKGVNSFYTFEQVGSYRVSLRVIDNNGDYDIEERTIEVTKPVELQAVISHSNKEDVFYTNREYTFDGANSASPNGAIKKYNWNFGDGSKDVSTRTVQHTFTKAGLFTMILKVTDESGETAETSLQVDIRNTAQAPMPVVETNPSYVSDGKGNNTLKGAVPLRVEFDALKSTDSDDDIVEYGWDFDGDGIADNFGAQTTKVYDKVGTYSVTLTVTDAKKNESTWKLIVEAGKQGLQAKITAEPIDGEVPLDVDFDASGSSYPEGKIVSYIWDFGDGSAERPGNAQISYRYEKIGTFTAKIIVKAADGSESEATIAINVRPVTLTACFTANVKEGPAPLTVKFNPSCSVGTIQSYNWDFSGQTSRDRTPTITFENAGEYEVTLEVRDNQNVIDRYTDTITVK